VSPLALVGAGAAAALTTAFLTPLCVALARRVGMLDVPGGYKTHVAPVPLLGGLALAAGLGVGALVGLPQVSAAARGGLAALAAGGAVIFCAGLVDDRRGLSPGAKLAWQLGGAGVAGLVLAVTGVRLQLYLAWPVVPIVMLTTLWVVAVTNAFNLLDHANGLCAGVGGAAAAALAAINLHTGEPGVALVAAALAGACLGFLPWNWPRARIFLGDAGSMGIGFVLAALAVRGVYTRGAEIPGLAVFVPVLVLAVPLLDMALVVALRLRAGCAPWRADRRHWGHRLVKRGVSPPAAAACLWAAAAGCGLAALVLPRLAGGGAVLLLCGTLGALAVLAAAGGREGLDEP
jgi:UDP-GlcNAc:undecaprenyl-phosphate GlcNAc-1-phosphate transferase